jgi:hypothetical protein
MIGSKSVWDDNSLTLADHEIIHVYQKNYWASQHMNCWTTEGHANFLGLAISSDLVNVNKIRSQQISMIGNIFPNFRNFTSKDWVSNLNSITADWNTCFSKGTGYSVGMLIFEYLHEKYSFDQVNNMLLSFSKNRNIDVAVKEVLNINTQDLYNGIAEYMVFAVKESQ